MKISRPNIGEIIRDKVQSLGMSKAQFAKKIGMQRQNVEKTVFEKASLDTNLLCEISEVLQCNLFDYYKCNTGNYPKSTIKAKLTIEIGEESQDKTINFTFGENNVKIQ